MTIAKHWGYKDQDLVLSNLKGLCHSNPSIGLIPSEKVVFNTANTKNVCIISGGGAGHEPLHGGYVGDNLLDAAVSGSIFASPSTKQIMAAIKTKANKENGTLIIVKNYTGDILHFGLVVERAKSEGYKIEMLAVTDDVAVGRKQNAMVGRRGLAGTAIIHKLIGGASNDDKLKLDSLYEFGKSINDSLVTLGASLDRTSVPGKSHEELEFNGDNEAELGLGIHNEPGTKLSPIPNIDDLIKDMFHKLLSPQDKDRHYVDFNDEDESVLLINNIGGTSSLELYAITEHALLNWPLSKKPKRVLISDFVTSLNSPGFSITLLNLTKTSKESGLSKERILNYLDLPTNAPGWKPKTYNNEQWAKALTSIDSPMNHVQSLKSELTFNGSKFQENITKALKKLIKDEPAITHYDTLVGDGDCGETLVAGANGILKAYENNEFETPNDPIYVINKITEIVEDSMGGTSGGIYSIYLTSLVANLQNIKSFELIEISKALHSALYEGLFKYTKARIGGRTLVDTLQPFVDTINSTGDISKAIEAAKKGCDGTKDLEAKFGRASYVDSKEFDIEGGIPDPGAVGLLSIIEGFHS